MDKPLDDADDANGRPTLWSNRSFLAMTGVQFLGAFNDNVFKQLVLLLCVDVAAKAGGADHYQSIAQIVFSLPFILFSGTAGFLADRFSKSRIIFVCKLAEVGIVLAGMAAFGLHSLFGLMVVLFCMGSHSAFFGPSKYGILPETVRSEDLPRANGLFLMTTFLAIIFGVALAGALKEAFNDSLWIASAFCLIFAGSGVAAALMVRATRAALPSLRFHADAVFLDRLTVRLLKSDWRMTQVLMVSSSFWFVAGVVQTTVNSFGRNQLKLGDGATSLLGAAIAVGIAGGAVLAGKLSGGRPNFTLVRVGAWGLFGGLVLLSLPGLNRAPSLVGPIGAGFVLFLLGVFTAMFAIPLQVFLQARPPKDQKGRVLGAMNLINFIGILAAGMFYGVCTTIFALPWLNIPPSGTFLATALVLAPIALFFYIPPDEFDAVRPAASAAEAASHAQPDPAAGAAPTGTEPAGTAVVGTAPDAPAAVPPVG
ncbi:MAG: MFS transporter [Planctomycetia bacterium]